ncbi:MAG: hypothetical protein IKN66_05540 [Ruminococcus sp.]|nr:hypothetical protein [Ruminococcus sp.]
MESKKPIAAILQISIGIVLLVITFAFLLLGKIENKADVIFAVLIAFSGLGEGIIGLIELKKQ